MTRFGGGRVGRWKSEESLVDFDRTIFATPSSPNFPFRLGAHQTFCSVGRLRLKCDGTRAETRFRLSAKRTSPFKSAEGRQFSRLLAARLCASAVVMLDTPCSEVVWRVLATYFIRQFPLQFLLSCVTVCHHVSTGLYLVQGRVGGPPFRSIVELKNAWS